MMRTSMLSSHLNTGRAVRPKPVAGRVARVRGGRRPHAGAREAVRGVRVRGPRVALEANVSVEPAARRCGQLGAAVMAFPLADTWAESLPYELSGMIRSRANTIEGGTTDVNKNVIGEKVLGRPREPDPWQGPSGGDTPR